MVKHTTSMASAFDPGKSDRSPEDSDFSEKRACDLGRWLTLGKLRAAAGATEAVLLAFLHAAVAGEQTAVAERLG